MLKNGWKSTIRPTLRMRKASKKQRRKHGRPVKTSPRHSHSVSRPLVHPSCQNTIVELSNYAYDQDKDGKYIDKPIKEFDHLMDSMRYASEKFFIRAHGAVAEAKGMDKIQPVGRRSKRVVSA